MTTNTGGLIKAIQTGRRRLGMDEETYRALLADVSGGKTSSKELNAYQLKEVLRRMREAGFGSVTDGPQMRKIKQLWLEMHKEGIVRNKSDRAVSAYIQRITKKSPEACRVKDLQLVIETLKQWIERIDDEEAQMRLLHAYTSLEFSTDMLQ